MLKVKKSFEAVIFVTYYSNSLHMYIFFYVCLWKGACLCLWFWELGLVSEVSLGSGHAFDLIFVLFSELDTSFLHFITLSDHWGLCFTHFGVSPTTLYDHQGLYHTYFRVSSELVVACITTSLATTLSDHQGLYHTYLRISSQLVLGFITNSHPITFFYHQGLYHTYFRVSLQLVVAYITTSLAITLSDH